MEEARTDKGIRANRSQLLGAEVTVLLILAVTLVVIISMAYITLKNRVGEIYYYLSDRQSQVVYHTVFNDDERARWDAAVQEIYDEQTENIQEFMRKLVEDTDFQKEVNAYFKTSEDLKNVATTDEEKDNISNERMIEFLKVYVIGDMHAQAEEILNKHGFYRGNNRNKEIDSNVDRFIDSYIGMNNINLLGLMNANFEEFQGKY